MNRIDLKFKSLKEKGHKAFVTFITAGDPSTKFVEQLVPYLDKIGVDIVELGIPFSDPMADGPVIQEASERAILKGTNLKNIFDSVKRIRQKTQVPILLMGYYNNVLQFGLEEATKRAAAVGVDAFLIVDLPSEEAADFQRLCRQNHLHQIFLIAPTTPEKRLKKILKVASGFLYYVSITGITGAKLTDGKTVLENLKKVKNKSHIPVIVGFGIKGKKDVMEIRDGADGVVVGSALIQIIKKAGKVKLSPALKLKIKDFIRPMSQELKP